MEESSRLSYELQLRVSASSVTNKLFLLHIGKGRTLKPEVVATLESVLKHTDIISSQILNTVKFEFFTTTQGKAPVTIFQNTGK